MQVQATEGQEVWPGVSARSGDVLPGRRGRVVVVAPDAWPGRVLAGGLKRAGVDVAGLVAWARPDPGAAVIADGARALCRRAPWAFGGRWSRLVDGMWGPARDDGVEPLGVRVHVTESLASALGGGFVSTVGADVVVLCGMRIGEFPPSLPAAVRGFALGLDTGVLSACWDGGSRYRPLSFEADGAVHYAIYGIAPDGDRGGCLHREQVGVRCGETFDRVLRRCLGAVAVRLARVLGEAEMEGAACRGDGEPASAAVAEPPAIWCRQWSGPDPMARLKRAVHAGAYWTGVYPARRRDRNGGRLFALAWHRALDDTTPTDDWRRILGHPTVRQLREKIAYVRSRAECVGVARATELLRDGRPLERDYAVLTVDDGYKDFRTHALPMLEELDVPAALFVCSGAVEGGTVWYQDVYNLIDRVPRDRLNVPWMGARVPFGDVRHRVLTVEHVLLAHLKQMSRAQREQSVRELLAANGVDGEPSERDAFCTVEELRDLQSVARVELCLHGHRHDPLDTLSADEVKEDLRASQRFFRTRLGMESKVLGYPVGTWHKGLWPTLRELGIEWAFTARDGFDRPGSAQPLALHRIGISGAPMAEFAWRLRMRLARGNGA